jgi:hypothetical protein
MECWEGVMNTRLESSKLALAATVLTASALAMVGCGSSSGLSAQGTMPNGQTGLPGQIAVNCGVGQQTMIRASVVNGQAVSQVECVAAPAGYAQPQPAYVPAGYAQPVYPQAATSPVGYVQAPVYAEAARPVAYRPAVTRVDDGYVQYRPVRKVKTGRSWQKSAVIIGSSAGIGAGIGAASGGKKGALIGAAIGGGASAIWDQVTRSKR